MIINTKTTFFATLLLLSSGRWGGAIGSDPLIDRLLSADPGVQTQALQETEGLSSSHKRLIVDELAQALRVNAVSAEKAARALAQLGTDAEPAIPDLIDALRYDEETVYAAVANALLKAGSGAIDPLRRSLSDSNFFVRRRACEILGQFGSKARNAAPQVVQLLKDPEVSVHNAADTALLKMGDSAVSALTEDLLKEDESDRKLLVLELAKFGKPAAPAILVVLKKDESAYVRGAAADALSQMHDAPPEVISALMAATHDLDEGMRGSAIDALGQMGPNAAAALGDLIVLSHTDGDSLVRAKAQQAVEYIGHGTKDSLPGFAQGLRQGDVDIRLEILDVLAASDLSYDDALPLIILSQKDENPAVRIKGLVAASKLQKQSSAALQILAVAMTDQQPEVRSAAIHELGLMKQDAAAAANALGAGLKDPNPSLREQTIVALSHLGPDGVPFLIQGLVDSYSVLSDQAAKAILKQGKSAIPALEAAVAGPDTAISKKAGILLKRLRRKQIHAAS